MKLNRIANFIPKHFLFLLLFAVIAYWPVSFMVFSAKGDAINYFLAMRYNISETIHNGFFPYWSPFINLGYPIHGDMQSGVWNPIVLLLSFIRVYDIYWLHVEIILIIFLAGIGMYRLLGFFRFEKKTILLVSLAYMLNGYMADAGQFLNWMYAAAFLPFVFYYLLKCFSSFSWQDAFSLGVAQAFMFLCAYPADFILLSYIILFYILISFLKRLKKNNPKKILKEYSRVSFIILLVFIITCISAILSYAQFLPLIDRGKGTSLQTAFVNSLAPSNLLSLIMPWPTMKGDIFSATDPLIRNCYMGIFIFIFFLLYFFSSRGKDFNQKFLIGIFIILLIFSFGEFGGLRAISYYTLPLMNTFRHPANAKLFFIFSAQVLAAFAIDRYLFTNFFPKLLLKRIILFVFIVAIICFSVSSLQSNLIQVITTIVKKYNAPYTIIIRKIREQLSFYDLLLLNSIFLIVISAISFWLIRKDRLKRYLLPLVCIDLFISVQMMIPLTYVSKTKPTQAQAILNKYETKGYPLPSLNQTLNNFSKNSMQYFEQIGCLNPYTKKPGRSEFPITPSNLTAHESFWQNTPLRDKIMNYPLAYIADTIFTLNDTADFVTYNRPLKMAITDSCISVESKNSFLTIQKFDPNHFEFLCTNSQPAFFVLLQNYYPNWEMTVNGKRTPIIKTNIAFMGALIPAGKNKIVFIYLEHSLNWLALLSLIFVITGLILTRKKIKLSSFEQEHN